MSDVLEEIRSLIPAGAQHSGTGWSNFNCPSCGDKRNRGGFNFTTSGGFRYSCFNGGCEWNAQPTGWEPGNGFGGRPRRLFEQLGGDIRTIPTKELLTYNTQRYDKRGKQLADGEKLEVSYQFPEVDLPPDTYPLMEAAKKFKKAADVFRWAYGRYGEWTKELPFAWSAKRDMYLILPFFHYDDKIVGYVGRHIGASAGGRRFIGKAPADYMFNQHILSSHSAKYIMVVESPIDAALLGCLATRADVLTQKQINLLRVSGKDPVLIPDYKAGEYESFLNIARENDWHVASPNWISREATDVGDSIKNNGKLLTIELILRDITKDCDAVETKIRALVKWKERNE